MPHLRCSLILLLAGCAAADHAYAEQTCMYEVLPSTASSARFALNRDGTAYDNKTKLTWKRCSEGQVWNGASCTGAPLKLSWQDALQLADGATYAGKQDWRLPNIKELGSIVEKACETPAIDSKAFPNTPSDDFWTSSPFVGDTRDAWIVGFYYGSDAHTNYKGSKEAGRYIRLVRGGP